MISDVMSDAVGAIDHYLFDERQTFNYEGEMRAWILSVRNQMIALGGYLDACAVDRYDVPADEYRRFAQRRFDQKHRAAMKKVQASRNGSL